MLTEMEAEQYARFLAYDEERLAYLVPQLAELDAQREALEARRKTIVEHIARVRESAVYYRAALTTENGNGASTRIPVPKDAFKGLPFLEAAKKYLRMMGTPQTTREIAEALRAGGYESASKHFTNTARTALDRAAEKGELILREKRWALPEWERIAEGTPSDAAASD